MSASDSPSGGVTPALSRATVDRCGLRRDDEEWLRRIWEDPAARVLVLRDGQVVVHERTDGLELALVAVADAPQGDRYLLGVQDGVAYWAVHADGQAPTGSSSADLRSAGALLSDRDAGLLVHAVALANWHATHPHCARCGAPTVARRAGHVRRCEADGSLHFPRVDPAVIMLVHDGGERVVLGRKHIWPAGRHSILAGFVEPGESLEQAVAREVVEEVGLGITDIRYHASQPWPFPSSLMLGFSARAVSSEPARRDLATDLQELQAARWFTRDEVRAAQAGEGNLKLPPPLSIARRLLDTWVARAL